MIVAAMIVIQLWYILTIIIQTMKAIHLLSPLIFVIRILIL